MEIKQPYHSYKEESDAETVSEDTKLLPGSDCLKDLPSPSNSQSQKSDYRFYIIISIILIFIRGFQEMASVTLKQFVYSWCLSEVTSYNNSYMNSTSGHNSTDDCGHEGSKATELAAQKMASNWELYFNLLNAVLVFVTVSTFGTLSDYFGRKPFFCIAQLGYALKSGIIAAVIYFNLHIAWILLAYGIDGLCGSVYVVSMCTYSSTADVTQRSGSRILAIALMEMVLGVGKLTTQFGNGYFIQEYGYFYPMLTATAGTLFSFLFTILAFKETNVQRTRQQHPTCAKLISRYIGFYVTTGSKKDRRIFWLCLLVFVLVEISLQGRSDPVVLYQLGSPFCLSSEVIGWYDAVSILLWYILGLLMLKPLQFCMSANTVSCLGIVSSAAMFVVTGLAPSTLWIFLAVGFGFIMVLPKPVLRALASSKASETEQGAIFAGLQSSELFCKMVSSPVSLSIYSASLDTMKGLVFLCLAGIDGLALIFMIYLTLLLKRKTERKVFTVIQHTE